MKPRKQSVVKHAAMMVMRNFRSYAMLSVTVVLSFSLLLGYLVFSDSKQYNLYKSLFASPSNVVMTYADRQRLPLMDLLPGMVQRADPAAKSYYFWSDSTRFKQYEELQAQLFFYPEGRHPLYRMEGGFSGSIYSDFLIWESAAEMEIVAGRDHFELHGNEAFISRNLYRALGMPQEFPFTLAIPYTWRDYSTSILNVQVVGVCANASKDTAEFRRDPSFTVDCQLGLNSCSIYTTLNVLEGRATDDLMNPEQYVYYACENPQKVTACIKQLGLFSTSVFQTQAEAEETLLASNNNKFYTVLLLLLILGLNLYSSFLNALSDRAFEIGVKRAIGASSWDIIRQFLLEGFLVMFGNILLSVFLVCDMVILYKWFQIAVLGQSWIAHITIYSALMFFVCALSLTVLFSTVFAVRSSRIEIIRHLKAE